jgi:hypothetical protein
MRVRVVRRGGLAGVALSGDAETSELPMPAAAAAEAALSSFSAGKAAGAPSHPDAFAYEVSFDGRSVTLDESEISDDLRPIIDLAMSRATLG